MPFPPIWNQPTILLRLTLDGTITPYTFYQSVQKGLEALGYSNAIEIAKCLVKNER